MLRMQYSAGQEESVRGGGGLPRAAGDGGRAGGQEGQACQRQADGVGGGAPACQETTHGQDRQEKGAEQAQKMKEATSRGARERASRAPTGTNKH